MKEIKIVYEGGEGELIEKKSRFIATVRPVEGEEEALDFIAAMKKKYWNATHNCSAFVVGENQELQRCSDDGEPQGTAGRPMLDVLLGEEVHNAAVVVTRYFGGTLLGTGGLVRAYSKSVQEGLRASKIIEKKIGALLAHQDGLQRAWQGAVSARAERAYDHRLRVHGYRDGGNAGAAGAAAGTQRGNHGRHERARGVYQRGSGLLCICGRGAADFLSQTDIFCWLEESYSRRETGLMTGCS